MKSLSNQMILELEIAAKFAGKSWAYAAVLDKNYGAALGIAVANEAGYSPVPAFFCNGTYAEMSKEADRLNAERGLGKEESVRIVCSSMAAGRVPA